MMWKDALFRRLKDQMTDAALDLIKVERDGYNINHGIIKGLIESFGVVFIYRYTCFL